MAGVPCKVGDTNGAGDTFFGAALSKLCKEELDTLTVDKLEGILAFANKAASITTTLSASAAARVERAAGSFASSPASFCCRGVASSLLTRIASAIFPISVCIPVAVISTRPLPYTTLLPI